MSDTPAAAAPDRGAHGPGAPDAAGLVAALRLEPTAPLLFEQAYVATTQPCPWPKAYGGDMVAQAAVAAMRSCPDKTLHSMHSYFMRPVDIGAHIHYEVELLRDGRGYATRQVRALQNGKCAYVALASFHAQEVDAAHWAPQARDVLPLDVPDPEELPTSAQVLADVEPGTPQAGTMSEAARDYWRTGRSVDMRHVPGPMYVEVAGDRVPHQGVWVRAFASLPDAPGLDADATHRAALAYACDYTIIEPTLRVLGIAWSDPGLVTASLDHAMWFQAPARVDDWLLYAQSSAGAQAGRGLGIGRFFDRQGRLVATLAQEAMIRPGAPAPHTASGG